MDLTGLGLPINLGLFAAAAVVVWFAGSRLSHYADAISQKTGASQAIVGLLLLAGVTSLPEIAVTATSAFAGDKALALNNLFGSIAMQVAILAVVDFFIGRKALTASVPEPSLMLQGGLNVLLLSFAGAAMIVGDILFFGVGIWSTLCLFAYVGGVWLLSQAEGRRPWIAARHSEVEEEVSEERQATGGEASGEKSLRGYVVKTAIAGAIILVAGFVLSRSGDAIAEQTGLGGSFVGFVLLATSTSLPEVSTALSAARLGRFTMAISDILGTNIINVGLVFLIDVFATGDPVFNVADDFARFGVLLSIMLTSLFLIGLAERRNWTLARMGIDSIAVLITYTTGIIILYALR
jgi:cation:H+ antiporter